MRSSPLPEQEGSHAGRTEPKIVDGEIIRFPAIEEHYKLLLREASKTQLLLHAGGVNATGLRRCVLSDYIRITFKFFRCYTAGAQMAQKPPARGKKGDPLIGAVVERRWRIIDQIGSGGMGAVYRGERVHLGKQVALKFLHPSVVESKSMVARFEREAKAVSRLHHVNCVSILDFGVYRKQPYIVMEYVEGRQLTELDPDTLTPHKGVAIMRQILLGLAHAHGRGVIHRDLKLSNVMLVEMTGTDELVKLLDFGLARLVGGDDPEKSLTRDGFVAGTPTYMSPEQCLGKTVDQRSDLYSAGVVLYTLCTGKRPFNAEDTAVLLHKQIHEAPVPPRKMAPQKRISERLEWVILHSMEKKPEQRFQTALDFLRALDETAEGQATQTPTVARLRAPRSRRKLLLVAALLCMVAGGAVALYLRSYFIAMQKKVSQIPMFDRWSKSRDAGAHAPTPPAPQKVIAKTPTPTPVHASPPDAAPAVHSPPEPEPKKELPPEPEPKKEPPPPPVEKPKPAAVIGDTAYHQEVDQLLKAEDLNGATNVLRNHLGDPWAHLRLGNIYATPKKHWRPDAFREWDKAFTMDPSLKTHASHHLICEVIDVEPRETAETFLSKYFESETPSILTSCLQKASGEKACQQRKAAAEMLAKLRYTKARSAIDKLERARQAEKAHPTPQTACFGESLAKALDELKE